MTRRERAYNRRLAGLIKKAGRLEDREVKRVLEILEQARKDVAAMVASSEWQAYHIPQLKEAVEQAIERFRQQYLAGHAETLVNHWNAGIDMIDAPLYHVGFSVAAPEISRTALEIAQGFSVDLIKGLSADGIKNINSEIVLGIMGQKSPVEVMKAIGRSLKEKSVIKNIAHRAEAITRTEMARVHSAAREARIEALKEGRTDPPMELLKKWLHSAKARPRLNHLALDGVMVPVDEDFPGGLPFPHAPGLPAAEVVSCGCTHVVTAADWEALPKSWEAAPYEERAIYD